MKSLLILLLTTFACSVAGARPIIYSVYEKVEQATVIAVGEVVKIEPDRTIEFALIDTWKGEHSERKLRLPFRSEYAKTIESVGLTLTSGQRAILFLTRTKESGYMLCGGSQGAIPIADTVESPDKDAVKQLIAVQAATDEASRTSLLANMLQGTAPQKRAALGALQRISLFANHDDLNKNLISNLSDSDFVVRRDAVQVLGKLHVREAASELKKKLNDEHPAVRSAAAAALPNTEGH